MAKLGCLCGNSLSNVAFPNNLEGLLNNLWEEEYTQDNGLDVWECKDCGRLAIEDTKNEGFVKWYKPENGEPGDLL